MRFRTLRERLTAAVNDADCGVTAYDELPNQFEFPALFVQPVAERFIEYNARFEDIDAGYNFEGYVMVERGDGAQDVLDDLLSPDSALITALNQPDLLGAGADGLGRLLVQFASGYGELEVGSRPLVVFGSRLSLRVEP